jgi:hypothetical protein
MEFITISNINADFIKIEYDDSLNYIKLFELLFSELKIAKYIILHLLKDNELIINGYLNDVDELIYILNSYNNIDITANFTYIKEYDLISRMNEYFTYDIYTAFYKSIGYYESIDEQTIYFDKCLAFFEEINFNNIINLYLNFQKEKFEDIITSILCNIFTIDKFDYLVKNKLFNYTDFDTMTNDDKLDSCNDTVQDLFRGLYYAYYAYYKNQYNNDNISATAYVNFSNIYYRRYLLNLYENI